MIHYLHKTPKDLILNCLAVRIPKKSTFSVLGIATLG